VRGLNKTFRADPMAFLGGLLLTTRPRQPCPTCHCVMDLGIGAWQASNVYARPDPMVLTFDLIGGAYGGNVAAGASFSHMLDAPPAQPPAAGLAFTDPLATYATLQVMKVGDARAGHPRNWQTNEYAAYWLPWTHQGATEMQLTDPHVRFFFTAMFSGCSFAVATPAGANGPRNVWVTHIAFDPGGVNTWTGAPYVGVGPNDRRLEAEAAFYLARGGAGSVVRSIVAPVAAPAHTLPMAAGRPALPAVPIAAGPVPGMHARFSYGNANLVNPPMIPGTAFIVGWRGDDDGWRFAVQKHPLGFDGAGNHAVVLPANVAPVAVRQFY
jgi:hypothetical protein